MENKKEVKEVSVHIRKKRGFNQVFLFITKNEELLVEDIFEYTYLTAAMKKLNELRKKYKLAECNYANNIQVFENREYKL